MRSFSTRHLTLPCLLVLILFRILVQADTPADSSSPAAPQTQTGPVQPLPNSFKVLKQRHVSSGGHSITYNLITPPALPLVSAQAPAAPTPAQLASAQKHHQTLALGATVYDHRITDLQWVTAGTTFHVFSNIDFNDFAGVGSFETTDMVYDMFLMIGNQKSGVQLPASAQQQVVTPALPDSSQFPQGQSGYIVPAGAPSSQNDTATFAALFALGTYYDANRTALHQAAEASRAANRAREKWLLAHPPAPQPTVIHLWKIQANAPGGSNP